MWENTLCYITVSISHFLHSASALCAKTLGLLYRNYYVEGSNLKLNKKVVIIVLLLSLQRVKFF
jgi:hypothetical protein